MKHTHKLNELCTKALLCLIIAEYHRAVDYRSVMKLTRLAQDIEGFIKHQIGDLLQEIENKEQEEIERIRMSFTAELEENPDNEPEINKRFQGEIKRSQILQDLDQQKNDLWNEEHEYEIEPIQIPYKDFASEFPDDIKEVQMLGLTLKANGLVAFKKLDLQGVINVID